MTADILVTADGTPIPRPERGDYADDITYARAVHSYNDAVTAAANAAFERAFKRAMKERQMKKNATIKIEPHIKTILMAAAYNDNALTLVGQLDRGTYVETDKVLRALGAKWNRGAKAHVFPGDAREAVKAALDAGGVTDKKKQLEQFWTPEPLAAHLAELVVRPGDDVLEPSAGSGRLADAAIKAGAAYVDCVEFDADLAPALRARGHNTTTGDFLAMTPAQLGIYTAVLMNPPFASAADAKHVAHAWTFVRPGGILGAIVSRGFTFRRDKAYAAFRELHAQFAEHEEMVEAGVFAESGTQVATALVVWRKPANDNGE